jgi:Protein of unknown function (DUF3710)
VFRRRRRDGEKATQPEPDEVGYSAADDELTEGEYDDADAELVDEFGNDDDLDVAGHADSDGGSADAGSYRDDDQSAEDQSGAPRARAQRADLGDPQTWTRLRDTSPATPAMVRSAGPWDGASDYPEAERIDFGSLLVPVREGYDVQVFLSEEDGISIAVVRGDSGLQLQPFAAPRSSGLWHEVMPEIADEVAKAGGQSREREGPFGPELFARVVPQGAGDYKIPPQALRFLGADGPRWFLRGLISGPAATDDEVARPFEDIFADVVVVRGDQPQPQRQALEIRLPDEARQVLEGEIEGQPGDQGRNPFDPFERGPEITETR